MWVIFIRRRKNRKLIILLHHRPIIQLPVSLKPPPTLTHHPKSMGDIEALEDEDEDE